MTDPTRKVTIGGTTIILPSTARVVRLSKSVSAAATTYTMEEAGTDYVVPTGKKLWIMEIKQASDSADIHISIYKHTVVDTAGGTLIDRAVSYAASNTHTALISVEAAKYINLNPAGNQTSHITVIGVELDV